MSDPFWAMKLLKKYEAYHRMAAADRDVFIISTVGEKPDRKGIYVNIPEEAYMVVPAALPTE